MPVVYPVSYNADTVDGFHASQTPAANTIPVANNNGLLNAGWMDFTNSKTVSGYTKLPNGIIIQWGMEPPCPSGTGWYLFTVVFPVSFPNACLCVVAQTSSFSGVVGYKMGVYVADFTTSSADIRIDRGDVTISVGLHWIAIGY